MKVGVLLHLQGPYISLEALTIAVNHLQYRHPFLRSRLQNNPTKPGNYLMEEDNAFRLKIREVPRKRNDHLHFWRQEWREREKESAIIGQGLVEFWLLQDPEDSTTANAPREVILICEHCVCDGLSLSTVAHELLMILSKGDQHILGNALEWPITMEAAIQRSLSTWGRLVTFGKFILAAMYWRVTRTQAIARIPLAQVDFSLIDMVKYCHTEVSYGTLCKEETQKLVDKCHRERVTVTSAVSSAILCASSTLVNVDDVEPTQLVVAIAADTRRRCIPTIPNHDLSYHVSGTMAFTIPTRDTPTTFLGMWQLASAFGHHVKTSIDAGQTLALGMIMGKIYEKNLGPPNLAQVPTFGISNWGVLPYCKQYGNWELIATIPFGNLIRAPMPFALIQTVNGVLTVVFVGSAPIFPLGTLENLRNGTLEKLRLMIEN
ncbi:unnamed protein product [Rotaria magnacalcarata]|uniref:Phthiocerol/phthiodiolone dimycocerosyl transferase C-terminal domain-containing protein n=1 Tax=Rotaria magnacalcarata TaxID=392030 RepID=A0A819FIT2_9BILA|nr:unnamed protein product [Rotaria magnacalcarata]CAF2083572.1 unnamed protein product [Rotaria magnacalcarata]CAF3867031.1 unnamed protein product [Rotaria magnacalcarata]CAF4049925.1 unnamed protein product [Rotaria magnacalcarata]